MPLKHALITELLMSRTDTWLSNAEELALAEDVSPWDPDTDDDGLTDGQEEKWLTQMRPGDLTSILSDTTVSFETSPTDPDTDGDGHWDGWLGVYGASNSSNVILYMEHLVDDDKGVQGVEAVSAQAGVHRVTAAPSPTGADLYGNGTDYHSNIHIGELQWRTEPVRNGDKPGPSLSLEVDFYEAAADKRLNKANWERGIEQNYQLYGINVDIRRDDTLSNGEFVPCVGLLVPPNCVNANDGFGVSELAGIELRHGDVPADEYVLVADKPQGGLFTDRNDTWGINLPFNPTQALFTKNMEDSANTRVPTNAVQNSSYSSKLAMFTAQIELHEIGHSLKVGRTDDKFELTKPRTILNNGEVYSGYKRDDTPEEVSGTATWSIMRRGWSQTLLIHPMHGRYYAFSIEELSTVEDG